MNRVLVIVPTYNEIESINTTLSRLRENVPEADVLVVDDGSPDGTGEAADRVAAADGQVKVLHRAAKQGLGRAYVAGFTWGLEDGYDVLVEMDADGSHQPEELPRLLDQLLWADIVIGSRYVAGGRVLNWPRRRELLSRTANLYARTVMGIDVADATAGMRAFRAEALRKLDLESVESQGYCFQVDLAWRAVQAGLRVAEVPITFVERTHGESKMDSAVVREALWKVTMWGATHRWDQVRRRISATADRGRVRR